MTALSEAVHQAQRATIAALGKSYVAAADEPNEYEFRTVLAGMGCADMVEQDYLLYAWRTLRRLGASAPSAPPQESRSAENDLASQKQLDLIARLCDEKGMVYPDTPLTKQQAHEIIDSLKAGTYNPDQWAVPF